MEAAQGPDNKGWSTFTAKSSATLGCTIRSRSPRCCSPWCKKHPRSMQAYGELEGVVAAFNLRHIARAIYTIWGLSVVGAPCTLIILRSVVDIDHKGKTPGKAAQTLQSLKPYCQKNFRHSCRSTYEVCPGAPLNTMEWMGKQLMHRLVQLGR